jgi:5'-nucleotidase (lipoprotein e(P4) family)
MKRIFTFLLLITAATAAYAQAPAAKASLEVKYVRDSAEYATLSRLVYRIATDAALAKGKAGKGAWGVVLDVDETSLDNSTYQLERATYDVPFEDVSWLAWINRAEAGSVPGTADFLNAVRAAGGKVAFISNRDEKAREGTQRNLQRNGLWSSNDLLCLLADNYPKAARRKEVAEGSGRCSWSGIKISVVAFIGDQIGDFPLAGEPFDGAGSDAQFGRSFFLIPNPMYGAWVTSVTRK